MPSKTSNFGLSWMSIENCSCPNYGQNVTKTFSFELFVTATRPTSHN